jgi:hypothetical protein
MGVIGEYNAIIIEKFRSPISFRIGKAHTINRQADF